MADFRQVLKDPAFGKLAREEQIAVLSSVDPEFAGIDPSEQGAVLDSVLPSVVSKVDPFTKRAVGENVPIPGVSTKATPNLQPQGNIGEAMRPAVEYGGLALGGAIGGVPGAGLGYAIGKGISDVAGGKSAPTLGRAFLSSAEDVGTGMFTEVGGQVAGKVVGLGAKALGAVGLQAVGRLTGAGTGAVKEAVKGGEGFTNAMRGKISGEDIVQNAKEALGAIKDARAARYQTQLQALPSGQNINLAPIQSKLADLMNRYGVKVDPATNELDLSRTALGDAGNRDVAKIIDKVRSWGMQTGDRSAVGLDTLKRQLDDFYSESSNARGFVATLRNEVKNTITKSVPEYAAMTKDYAEASRLIKDMESGLMLRKQGMSGRVVADQTLRRLTSSMRDNFQLRKELLDVLGQQGGQDLSGQVAGYAMSSYLPTGVAGVAPSILGSAAALKYLNPKFVPFIAASSPRVMGEFLRVLGKVAPAVKGGSATAGKTAAYLTVPPALEDRRAYIK